MDAMHSTQPRTTAPAADPHEAPAAAPGPRRPLLIWLREFAGFPIPPDHEAPRRALPRSRFIPLSRQAVAVDLCHDIPGEKDGQTFAMMALKLERHRNHDYRQLAAELRRVYLPFSPDTDTVKVCQFTAEEAAAMQARLAEMTAHLLTRANYSPLSTAEINAILNEQSSYSLRIEVDLDEYDILQVYGRDVYSTHHTVRRPETAYLLSYSYDVPVYRRLFVLLKLKSNADRAAEIAAAENVPLKTAEKRVAKRRKGLPTGTSTENIYIKVFKDMPEHDLQILFPLRRVQFRPFDKLKFYATAGGGTLFGLFSTTGKVVAATNPFAAVGALVAFGGLVARQVTGFFNQRNRYMMELSQKLFFHNLANNRAAITLLVDRAEEEDMKEDLITLYHLAGETVEEADLARRKAEIDALLAERYKVEVDFEIDDALRRLTADGAVTQSGTSYIFPTFAAAAQHYDRLIKLHDAEDVRHIQEDEAPGACEAVEAVEA